MYRRSSQVMVLFFGDSAMEIRPCLEAKDCKLPERNIPETNNLDMKTLAIWLNRALEQAGYLYRFI
jgi:hypothetical protein